MLSASLTYPPDVARTPTVFLADAEPAVMVTLSPITALPATDTSMAAPVPA